MSENDFSELARLAEHVGERLAASQQVLATAESCTGGWIAKCITDVAGSSAWFDRGFVTYANSAKVDMVGVSAEDLLAHGAVSEVIVLQMAQGALVNSQADLAVAVSGVAGPGGGSATKPVGTVCLVWATKRARSQVETCHFEGDRESVRAQTVARALQGLLQQLD